MRPFQYFELIHDNITLHYNLHAILLDMFNNVLYYTVAQQHSVLHNTFQHLTTK